MSYGRLNLDGNADNQDRFPFDPERRASFRSRPPVSGRVCPECHIRRTEAEFKGKPTCQTCRQKRKKAA